MNAYAMGQLAGMQKQALSIKGWRRLLTALSKEQPAILKGPTRGIHFHQKTKDAAKLLKAKFPRGEWYEGMNPSDTTRWLRIVAPDILSGRSTGWKTRMALDRLERKLGIGIDPIARQKSLAPRAVKLPAKALEYGRPAKKGVAFRGTNALRETAMSPGQRVHASGDFPTAMGYGAFGGEVGGVGGTGSERGQLLLKYRTEPTAFGARPDMNPHVKNYEGLIPRGDDPIRDVAKSWRVFKTWGDEMPRIRKSVYGRKYKPLGSMYSDPAQMLINREAQLVPLSKKSLRKWMANMADKGEAAGSLFSDMP